MSMRIRLTSDIHMEQYRHATVPADIKWDEVAVPPKEHDAESVLVLAGDICEFGYTMFFASMWKALSKRFVAVVYVPGNHEYFGATTPYCNSTFFYFKELFRKYGNIHLLDDTSVVIQGQKFYGTTLWTNYDNNVVAAATCMNMGDFRWSRTKEGAEDRPTVPQDYIDRHSVALSKLQKELEKGEDLVVVSHFAPSHQSVHARYAAYEPYAINLHYVNQLDELLVDSPQIKLWAHGHTHTQFDYMVGETRVVCNPRGFPGEDVDCKADLTYLEI